MKAFYVPALLLALILGFSLWTGAYVERGTAACFQKLQKADELAAQENWEEAEAQILQGHKSWQQNQAFFHAIMEHEELDEAESLFASAFAACDERDEPDFHATLAQLLKSLRHLSEKQQLSLNNIL